MDPKQPVSMTFSIGSIQDGIAFWLRNQVLRQEVIVKNVVWNSRDSVFTVEIDREHLMAEAPMVGGETNTTRCATCGTKYLYGAMCPKCYGPQ